MDEAAKDQIPAPGSARKSVLRYPLRSAMKSKEQKPPVAELPNSSAAPKRGRPASNVSKSVSVLELSGKEKSAKPPRRLSIPAKSTTTNPSPKLASNITPISESRPKRPVNLKGKSGTPIPDAASRSASVRKFSDLSKASYWLSQIKVAESASKHSISLAFFKLALEAGCEPLQKMRDELRSYARRHDLGELGDVVKELFEKYNISENSEQRQVSETCSQVPEEGAPSSDEDVHSSCSTVEAGLKPKSLNTDSPPAQVSSATEPVKDTASKRNPATRTRASLNKNSANSRPVSDTGGRKIQRKAQNAVKPEPKKEMEKIKKQGKKSTTEEGAANPSPATAETVEGNKENVDAP
ncbi:hypothetical protein SLE2022_290180 [Rubroshorea leprosula]